MGDGAWVWRQQPCFFTLRHQESSYSDLKDVLKTLKGMPITVAMHQRVPVGKLVNTLRKKCKDTDVREGHVLHTSCASSIQHTHRRPLTGAGPEYMWVSVPHQGL
jgi:hypothetical protein